MIDAGERHRGFVVRRQRDSVIVVGMHGTPGHCFGPMLLYLRVKEKKADEEKHLEEKQ